MRRSAVAALAALACAWLAAALPASAQDLLITGGRIYPDATSEPIDDGAILIREGRIAAVGPANAVSAPAGIPTYDAHGKVITAGFWNSHVHLVSPVLLFPHSGQPQDRTDLLRTMFTTWGFTTVVDLASTLPSAAALRAEIAVGTVIGPNVLTAGAPFYPAGGTPIYARPFYDELGLPRAEITTLAEAIARVERQAAAGANAVKLFSGAITGGADSVVIMPRASVRALVRAAHDAGLPVVAHPTNAAGLESAIDGGVDLLAHVAPLAGEWSPRQARRMARRGLGLIPTLQLFDEFPDPATPIATGIQQVRALHAAGGDILFGTDAGFMEVYDPTGEYRRLGEALDWRAILGALTEVPARRFGQANQRGRIAPGMIADLVVLADDPAHEITAFASVSLTVRDGTIIAQAER